MKSIKSMYLEHPVLLRKNMPLFGSVSVLGWLVGPRPVSQCDKIPEKGIRLEKWSKEREMQLVIFTHYHILSNASSYGRQNLNSFYSCVSSL